MYSKDLIYQSVLGDKLTYKIYFIFRVYSVMCCK